MITLLTGVLVEASPSVAVLDVGGVGFEVGISGTTAASLPPLGQTCRLFTRLQVREDAMTLFGFASKEERTMFDRLVAVSGVGPRLALAVLSKFTVGQLYTVVMAEDAKGMATVPGVGKKTAQRLILELKSVFAKDHGLLAADVPAQILSKCFGGFLIALGVWQGAAAIKNKASGKKGFVPRHRPPIRFNCLVLCESGGAYYDEGGKPR